MRVILPLAAVLLSTAAANAREALPLQSPTPLVGQAESGTVCRDRIHEVRRELGKPALQRDSSSADGLLIAAVGERITAVVGAAAPR